METLCLSPTTNKEGPLTDNLDLYCLSGFLQNFNVKGEVQVFLVKGLSRKSRILLGSLPNTQDGPKQVSPT